MTVVESRQPESSSISALPLRTAGGWSSTNGIDTNCVPWRLWEKAKKHFWDPADLDYSTDAAQWAAMSDAQQLSLAGLARGFMVGEEGVTLDILPLAMAMAEERRLEEVIFLTSFTLEEAKHIDFFRRWFTAVGADPEDIARRQGAQAVAMGRPDFDPNRSTGLFESVLPRVMRRLLVDRSPEAVLDASVTYNQFIEACLAISGYTVWGQMFESFGVLPALQQGLRHIRADEGRHITYGTFLCQRVLASNPELLPFARNRIIELRDNYYAATGNYPGQTPAVIGGTAGDEFQWNGNFADLVDEQVAKRIQILERAVHMSEAEMIAGAEAEEVQHQLLAS